MSEEDTTQDDKSPGDGIKEWVSQMEGAGGGGGDPMTDIMSGFGGLSGSSLARIGGASALAAGGGGLIANINHSDGHLSKANVTANAKIEYDELKRLGYSNGAAAGIVANTIAESSINPMNRTGDGGSAHGICQWHADRRANYAAVFGHRLEDVTDPKQALIEQTRFIDWELKHGDPQAKAAGRALMKPDVTAADAAQVFCTYFERPLNKVGDSYTREGIANTLVAKGLTNTNGGEFNTQAATATSLNMQKGTEYAQQQLAQSPNGNNESHIADHYHGDCTRGMRFILSASGVPIENQGAARNYKGSFAGNYSADGAFRPDQFKPGYMDSLGFKPVAVFRNGADFNDQVANLRAKGLLGPGAVIIGDNERGGHGCVMGTDRQTWSDTPQGFRDKDVLGESNPAGTRDIVLYAPPAPKPAEPVVAVNQNVTPNKANLAELKAAAAKSDIIAEKTEKPVTTASVEQPKSAKDNGDNKKPASDSGKIAATTAKASAPAHPAV